MRFFANSDIIHCKQKVILEALTNYSLISAEKLFI